MVLKKDKIYVKKSVKDRRKLTGWKFNGKRDGDPQLSNILIAAVVGLILLSIALYPLCK